ncbi:MAG: DNA repair protein RecO [Arthrobacter sp.]|uniref:DNA repair protein RecO n=1 Tax=unclassified Arthrobacter TaxID=235627 RepID=UPI00264AB67B|nr:DNA repair protein RecO [Micrococcaceae bacterium]MDN5823793.1 DNA repair protein RecO [Micrococcaceae bacterium]MDN5879214.1 DNA repair protein RecO [Micrococcaceae bacterium]MDN5887030.1 DNA repair protein RecO [Micrococcaceae bacterium]MDN5904931.1 DNA repair protein RecO [Micrococcaceae bacterium]
MPRSSFAAKSYRTRGLVLRTYKLGEADRIIVLLTSDHGQVRAVAKGVRRTSSKMGATLEPFMFVEAQVVRGRSLDIITQAQLRHPYGQSLSLDYSRYTSASAMAETAERLTEADTESAATQFRLLHGAIAAMARGAQDPGLLLDSYLLRALATAGWAPSFTDCVHCGAPGPHTALNIPLGGVVCAECRPAGSSSPAPATVSLLAALLTGDWPATLHADASARREAAGMVAGYLQWHLERVVKSLKHVERA